CSLCDMHEAAGRPWAVVLSSDLVGLGAVRSLHAGGVPTIVVMLDSLEPARASRYGQKILVPKSSDVEGALVDALAEENRQPLPGPDEALWECICLFDAASELARAFTCRKLATMPAHYGATSRGRSERNDALVALAARVGRRFNYTGIADIDVKYDARDGQYKYLELNPRLGVCHHFGTCCGKNVILVAYRLACGEDLPEDVPQVE